MPTRWSALRVSSAYDTSSRLKGNFLLIVCPYTLCCEAFPLSVFVWFYLLRVLAFFTPITSWTIFLFTASSTNEGFTCFKSDIIFLSHFWLSNSELRKLCDLQNLSGLLLVCRSILFSDIPSSEHALFRYEFYGCAQQADIGVGKDDKI